MDEAELVRNAKAGDEESFARLVERYRLRLMAFVDGRIPRPLRRKITAEDVLQDASITAHARLDRFEHRGEGAFRAWLWQIAQLKLQEAIRRFAGTEKRGAVAEISRGARRDTHHFAGSLGSPSEHAMAAELEEKVRRAMDALRDDYQHVLRLVRIERQSLHGAAETLGRSYEATKKLYGRAVAALAREVAAEPPTP